MQIKIIRNNSKTIIEIASSLSFFKLLVVLLCVCIYAFITINGASIFISHSFHWSIYLIFILFNSLFVFGLFYFSALLLHFKQDVEVTSDRITIFTSYLGFKKKLEINFSQNINVEKWQSLFFRGLHYNLQFLDLGAWNLRLKNGNKTLINLSYLNEEQVNELIEVIER